MKRAKVKTAFILGAGLGTRLKPLTDECPKPLLAVGGRPLITYAMDHCLGVGVERFIVNTHHCAAAYDRAFPERGWRGWPVLLRHEPVLLDTAGGLKNIEDLLDREETLLVYNGDILSDLPLAGLLEAHAEGGREVTLVLRSRGPVPNVSLDAEGRVCDLRGLLGKPGVRRCGFAGIYAVDKKFLGRLTPGKAESVVPVFIRMISERPGSVGAVLIDEGRWEDIGSAEAYERIRSGGFRLRYEEGGGRSQRPAPFEEPLPPPGPGQGAPGGTAADASAPIDERRAEAEPFVRAVLGLPTATGLTLIPVGRGGSDRDYFRVACPGREPAILMRYNRLREENNYYAAIAGFLEGIGVAVPAILGHDPGRGLLMMEDLGDGDLFALRAAPWEARRGLYEKTLRLADRLHAFDPDRFPADRVRLMPGFGPELYRWEHEYFREQCVRKACGLHPSADEERALGMELAALTEKLCGTPRSLVHRDLQSQNVMIAKGEPVLIDFQGMRFGNPFYDLASLLMDPYVEIHAAGRRALLRHYYDLAKRPYGWEAFEEQFLLASAQRLMQALGAYGFLGIEREKTHFLSHIPPALERLAEVAGRLGCFPRLSDLALRCRAAFAARVS